MDAIFCEPDNLEHKQRRSSLKAALIKSLPKPDGLKTVTAITTARGALLQLADYALWQFFCGSGGSGSAKLNMSHRMPVLYNIILVVVQKITNVTEKEAATAVSTSLKNTKNRSSARKYLEKLRKYVLVLVLSISFSSLHSFKSTIMLIDFSSFLKCL